MLKQKEKLIFVLLLFSCIFLSMSFISANENIVNIDSYNIGYNESIVDSSDKSFTDLNNLINNHLNKSEIVLDDNYVYQGRDYENVTKSIFINRSMNIDGKGYVIDANGASGIFHINANNVILKNLILKNSKSYVSGAIFCNGTNITIINSTFIGNSICSLNYTCELNGAAINYRYSGTIINSTFINNHAYKIDNESYLFMPLDEVYLENRHESISYGMNCKEVYDIVSFEKNHNVTIINSNFTNTPAIPIIYQVILSLKTNTTDKENFSKVSHNKIKKSSPNFIAKNKVLNKKTKIKKYTVTLKNKDKTIKNVWVTLKIKGKTIKAKTNNKGQATFKITKLTKKGKYKGKITFNGNKYYNSINKIVKIVIK